jgi:trk system potassium uptake protein
MLAEQLEQAGVRAVVMERDPERARTAAERLRHTTVLQEEGVSKEALLAHGVDRAGAFVAAAGDDRSNLLAALNAKQAGAELALAVVSREEFTPLVDALGIDGAVSPRLITAEAILQAIQGGGVEEVHLTFGGSEVLDVRVQPGCSAEGRTAEAVAQLARTRVAAVVRGDRVFFPGEGDTLRAGDHVLTFNARRGVVDVPGAFATR